MDDPPPLPGAIDILLASITSTSLTITSFIRAVRSARADLGAITRELADLYVVLDLLRDDHAVPTQMQARVRAVLRGCGVILARITALVADSSGSGSGSHDGATRVRWSTRDRNDMTLLSIGLQTHREALVLVDDVAHLKYSQDEESPDGTSPDGEGPRQASKRILAAISKLRDTVPQAERAAGDSRKVLELYLDELAAYTAAVCREIQGQTPSSHADSTKFTAPRELGQPGTKTSQNAAAKQGSIVELDGEQSLETCGPWFPAQELVVPYYNSQEQFLKPTVYSYHIPRKSPTDLHHSNPLRQVVELPGNTTVSPAQTRQQAQPQHHRKQKQGPQPRHHHSPQQAQQPFGSPEKPPLAEQRSRSAVPPPLLSPPDGWATSVYVPASPASEQFSHRNSALSSDQTSFQTSSDYAVSQSMYRSSMSTAGTYSVMDSFTPASSPLLPFHHSLKGGPSRPESPYSTVSSITSSIMGRLPRFRSRRQSVRLPAEVRTPAPDARHSTPPSTASSSTLDRTPVATKLAAQQPPPTSPLPRTPGERRDRQAKRQAQQIELVPVEGLSDGKAPEIFQLDISPSGTILASQHANHSIKIWSVTTGGVESTVSPRAKFRTGPRTRMYFIRSHAIVSEASTLLAVSASFGNTVEVWDWSRRRRVQSIDRAARWASARADAYDARDNRPLAVYRAEDDAIDLFAVVGAAAAAAAGAPRLRGLRADPGPYVQSRRIEVARAGLPFVPHFPELAYSATAPLLVGAAGPRARAPPDEQKCILVAWQTDSSGPAAPQDGGDDEANGNGNPHRPYKWVVPPHPELLGALPACLACYGSSAVSVWLPANYRHIVTAKGETKRVPVATRRRLVLVWDLTEGGTRLFDVPEGPCCVSPDCRLVAYCDASASGDGIVVLDVASGEAAWRGGGEEAEAPGRALRVDLGKVNVLQFTEDGGTLFVGDKDGGVGIYEIKMRTAGGGAGRFEFPGIGEALGGGESDVSGS